MCHKIDAFYSKGQRGRFCQNDNKQEGNAYTTHVLIKSFIVSPKQTNSFI